MLSNISLQLAVLASTTIHDDRIPLSKYTNTFAVGNLILMLLTVIEAIITVALAIHMYNKSDEYHHLSHNPKSDSPQQLQSNHMSAAMSVPVAAIAIAEFFFTENIRMPVVLFDRYSIVMALFLCLQSLVSFRSIKSGTRCITP